jgi:hypothetical protein
MKYEAEFTLKFTGHKTAPEPMKLLVKTYVIEIEDEEQMPQLLVGLRDKTVLENIECEMTDFQPVIPDQPEKEDAKGK